MDSLDDLKGLKVRVAWPESEFVKAFGAVGVSIPPPELHSALDSRLIDAAILPIYNLDYLEDVVGQSVGPDFVFSGPMMHLFMFNIRSWRKPPKEVQAKIRQTIRSAAVEDNINTWRNLDVPFRKRAGDAGVKFSALGSADLERGHPGEGGPTSGARIFRRNR